VSRTLVIALLCVLFAGSTAATYLGVQEARLARIGKRQDLAAEEVTASTRGWVAVFGCLRHDLAVAVGRDGVGVHALGEAGVRDDDIVYTPLAARDDCEEGKTPKQIYTLVEDAAEDDNTIRRQYKTRVAPPPVPGFVDGVIGYGAGTALVAKHAFERLHLGDVPLLAKGRHPGVFWVAALTAAVGLHGYALIVVVWIWSRRRARKDAARGQFSDEENAFYDDDSHQA
jgi:hypothetical protein